MATRRPRVALAVVAAALLTVACSGSSGETDHGVSSGGFAVDADARSGLAILDETIPAEDIHGDYWPKHDDLRSISCGSDVAFVGRIAGYTEALVTVPPDAEDPDWARVGGVFDGLVFAVDELLVGDLNGSAQVTVAFWALQVDEGGSPRSRITGAPFEVIRPGIEQRDNPDGPRYLVYALARVSCSPSCSRSRWSSVAEQRNKDSPALLTAAWP